MCFIELKYEEGKGWGIVVWWGLWGGRLSCPPLTSWAAPGAAELRTHGWEITKHVHYQRAYSISYLELTQLKN